MKIAIESKSEKEIKFVLSDATIEFANLLRRYAINTVPVFAVDEAAVYENTSSFFDEYIVHRVGLIPLTTPSKAKVGDEVTLMLDAEGPGTIYAESMKTTDKNVHPTTPKMPIIKLLEGQRVRLEGKAILANGKKHARYQPGLASYGYDKEGEFRFVVESYGQMDAEEILMKALTQIQSNAEDIEKQLEKVE